MLDDQLTNGQHESISRKNGFSSSFHPSIDRKHRSTIFHAFHRFYAGLPFPYAKFPYPSAKQT